MNATATSTPGGQPPQPSNPPLNAGGAASAAAPGGQPHPSPQRDRVSRWAIWFAILAAPVAWSLQLLINAPIAGHGCYPHDVPLDVPIWSNLVTVTTVIEVVAVVICLAGGLVAWRNWQRTRSEKPGSGHHLMESGDGRTRFMAMVGVLVSSLFLIAALFACVNLVTVQPCGG